MSGNIIIIIAGAFIFSIALVILVIAFKLLTITVGTVKAGAVSMHKSTQDQFTRITPFDNFRYNGKTVNPRNYMVRKVDGDCMSTRNINAGNLVFIEEFKNDNSDKLKSFEKGDILFIEYKKENGIGFKLREFADFNVDTQSINTIYYTSEGKIKESSKPHTIKKVKGVVKMKFTV